MPQKGFYVVKATAYPDLTAKGYKECIYTTGVRGKGGHKYCRCWGTSFVNRNDTDLKWYTLLWSCVPGLNEMAEKHDYYPNFEDIPKELGFPQLPA